jgi:hypothetical protein
MTLSEIHQPPRTETMPTPAPAPATAGTQPETYHQCDECGAPVDAVQRYCVVCGAHRRHVNDPAARYLSQATARSRKSNAAAPARRSARASRWRGLGTALVLAVIPLVAAGGVLIGRSSNNDDSKLIQELAKRQAAVVTKTTSAASATPTGAAIAGATTAKNHGPGHKKGAKSKHASSSATGKASSTTKYGSVNQIVGSKPTQAQAQQGAAVTQQVQKSTGKNYVNGQSNLPGTVVVP